MKIKAVVCRGLSLIFSFTWEYSIVQMNYSSGWIVAWQVKFSDHTVYLLFCTNGWLQIYIENYNETLFFLYISWTLENRISYWLLTESDALCRLKSSRSLDLLFSQGKHCATTVSVHYKLINLSNNLKDKLYFELEIPL